MVFIQGTDANPIFSYAIDKDKTVFYRWFGDDYNYLDSTYTYAIIPKPGMAGIYKDDEIVIPKSYYEKNHLDYRIKQIDLSINHIVENHLTNPKKYCLRSFRGRCNWSCFSYCEQKNNSFRILVRKCSKQLL